MFTDLAKANMKVESIPRLELERNALRSDVDKARISLSDALREVAVSGERLLAAEKQARDTSAREQKSRRDLVESIAELAKQREVAENNLSARHEAEKRAMAASLDLATYKAAITARPVKKLRLKRPSNLTTDPGPLPFD
jgi:hypothetical protein